MDIEHGIEAARKRKGGYTRLSSPSESTHEEKDENEQNQADAQLQVYEPTEMSEIFALQQFYVQTLGRHWYRQDGWNTNRTAGDIHGDVHPRGWSGVTIGLTGRTVEIRLSDNRLSRPISFSCLAVLGRDLQRWCLLKNLKFLTVLDLSRNRLKGHIPQVLAQLEFLEDLNLDRNGFRGKIPSGFGQLRRLKYLRLSNNRLRGTIPRELGQLLYLRLLSLSQNRLTGHIPEEVKNLQDLQHLDCWNNELSGRAHTTLWSKPRYVLDFVADHGARNVLTNTSSSSFHNGLLFAYLYWLDLIEAWACMVTVCNGETPHGYPSRMYVFLMDASPKSLVSGSASSREAEAQSRAEEWVLWYLDKNGGQANTSLSSRLCQTRVRMVTLPQLTRTEILFSVTIREGKTHVFSGVPVVFGSVNANDGATRELKLEDFPHRVVHGIGVPLLGGQSRLPPNVTLGSRTFFLEGDELFAGRWEAYMRRRNRSFCGFRLALDRSSGSSPMGIFFIIFIWKVFFVFIYPLYIFTSNLVNPHPVPVFWASLAMWSAVFLFDLAAQCLRRRFLNALPGLVCRALLYGGMFWLTKTPVALTILILSLYWLGIPPLLIWCVLKRECFSIRRPTLQFKIHPVHVE